MNLRIPKIKTIDTREMVGGVSGKFFLRHLPLIVVGVFLALSYISVRFDCITAMETITAMKTRLEVVRTETQQERSHYMSSTCESTMQHMVDTMHLGLHIQQQPPYRLKLDK